MSDFQAIGGVSATLQTLLKDRMELPFGVNEPLVTIIPPHPELENWRTAETPRVNLFLYRVTENNYLKNQEIPGEGHPGSYGQPPLSLDLHYLLTGYGTTGGGSHFVSEIQSHYLLGSAMRVLHDYPIITDQMRTTSGQPILHPSLRGEFEKLKLCLEPISLEDISKVWTALTLPYRLSAAYNVSLVQIRNEQPRNFPRLVGEPPSSGPRIYVTQLRSPRIRELRVRRPGDPMTLDRPFPYVRLGDTLIIQGSDFASQSIRVTLGGLEIPVTPLADDRIELLIADRFPDGSLIPVERQLQPGPQSVGVQIGLAELPQTGFRSNQAVLMLVPQITSLTPNLSVEPRSLQIQGTRLFVPELSGEVLVDRTLIPKATYRSPTSSQITVPLPDTLPTQSVPCLLSGALANFPNLPTLSEVQVTIGTNGPRVASFASTPTTPTEAAEVLQAAIRSAPGGGPAFKSTRVATAGDRLVIVPGGLTGTVTISETTVAQQLRLTTSTGAVQVQGYLSGELTPFPALIAVQPKVQLAIGNTTHIITLNSRPTTLASAATQLETAIQNQAGFAGVRVTTLENQLLFLPDILGNVVFSKVPGADETTLTELQLQTRYRVRVRVNGAETIDDAELEMPPP